VQHGLRAASPHVSPFSFSLLLQCSPTWQLASLVATLLTT